MAKTKLTIIVPELAAILNQPLNRNVLPFYLTKIIKHARFTADSTRLQRLLLTYFSETSCNGTDLPLAHLQTETQNVIFATPCHLYPDRDQLRLFHHELDINEQESAALIEEIQPLLSEFNGNLFQSQTDNWLLQLDKMPNLTLTALEDVTVKGVDASLPQGGDRQNWLRLWNEIQMQLHECKVNQQRVAQGKLPINGVWFWGMGSFTAKHHTWKSAHGVSPLLAQLTLRTTTDYHVAIDTSERVLSTGNHLIVFDKIQLESDWQQQLQELDDKLLKLVWHRCKHAKIDSIQLHIPDYGYYHLSTFDCWKFWK